MVNPQISEVRSGPARRSGAARPITSGSLPRAGGIFPSPLDSGAPLDGWRTEADPGPSFLKGLTHHKEAPDWAAWWVLWRRVAAGLPEEAHRALFEAIEPHLKPAPKGRVINPGKKAAGPRRRRDGPFARRARAAFAAEKEEAAGWLLERLEQGNAPGVVWALGRLGARVPVARAPRRGRAPAGDRVRFSSRKLLALDWKKHDEAPFAAAQLGRLSGDRARDLDGGIVARADGATVGKSRRGRVGEGFARGSCPRRARRTKNFWRGPAARSAPRLTPAAKKPISRAEIGGRLRSRSVLARPGAIFHSVVRQGRPGKSRSSASRAGRKPILPASFEGPSREKGLYCLDSPLSECARFRSTHRF